MIHHVNLDLILKIYNNEFTFVTMHAWLIKFSKFL